MNSCKVTGSGKAWRVVEDNGKPVMSGRVPSDGGAITSESAAWQLADRINARRKAEAAFKGAKA
jgi:hypothetical protein